MTSRTYDSSSLRLGPFLTQLRERLGELSTGELVACLLAHARTLAPGERAAFLALFSNREAGYGAPVDATLLDDIDELAGELREGTYVNGWGWDEAIRDERAWGDESWAPRMDALFGRAGDAFLAGDPELAAEAYDSLFRIFDLEEKVGPVFPGADVPTEMLETDLAEAYARFLRSLYEVESPSHRAVTLLAEVQRSGWLADRDGQLLAAVADAGEAPLPGFSDFLPRWIEALRRSEEAGDARWSFYGWERLGRRLLREAVERHGGVEGLAALARRGDDPQAYLDWSRRAGEEGDLRGALRALGEGVDALPEAAARAALADHLAALAAAAGQGELAFCCRRLAWRLAPTGRRLRNLAHRALETEGTLGAVMREELQMLRHGLEMSSACAGLVEVLAGDLAAAAQRLAAAPPVGWSSRRHPGTVLLPTLLVAGAGHCEPPAETILAQLWKRLDGIEIPHWSAPFADLHDSEAEWIEAAVGVAPPPPTAPGDLVRHCLADGGPPAEAVRDELLDTCRRVVLARARHIVSQQLRGAYDKAAAVAVAWAEALVLGGRGETGRALPRQLRGEFPRHSAFKRSLEDHEGRSSLLTAASGTS